MKQFLRNIFIVSLPFLTIIAYSTIIFFNHNLFKLYEDDFKYKKDILIGEPFRWEFSMKFKFDRNFDNYKILAIGSSRVQLFSQSMFKDPFFNLGSTAGSIPEINKLIQTLNIRNKILIIGIDQWAMNDNWAGVSDSTLLTSEIYKPSAILNFLKLKGILMGHVYPFFSKTKLKTNITLVGSGANLAVSGLLSDGSYYYGQMYHGLLSNNKDLIGEDYAFENTFDRIKNGNQRFEYGTTASKNALSQLQKLISEAKIRNNKLILFFPPFAPLVNARMDNDKYQYISDAREKIIKFCEGSSSRFYDFTNIKSKDSEFIDGFHGGKKIYYQIAKQIGVDILPCNFLNSFEAVYDSSYTRLRINFFQN